MAGEEETITAEATGRVHALPFHCTESQQHMRADRVEREYERYEWQAHRLTTYQSHGFCLHRGCVSSEGFQKPELHAPIRRTNLQAVWSYSVRGNRTLMSQVVCLSLPSSLHFGTERNVQLSLSAPDCLFHCL